MKLSDSLYALFLLLFDYIVIYILLDVKLRTLKKHNVIIAVMIGIGSVLISTYVAGLYGRYEFTSKFFWLAQVPLFLASSFVSKYRKSRLFFVFVSTFICSTPVIWSPFFVGMFFNYSKNVMLATSILVYLLMLFLVKKYIAPLFHYALENLQKGWLLLSALPILYAILSYLTDDSGLTVVSWQETYSFRILILAVLYSAYLLIFVLFKQVREQLLLKNEQTLLNLQLSSMRGHLEDLKLSQNMAAIYRHDLRHHFQYVNTCIEQANYTEASQYIMSICSEIETSKVDIYCENDSINAILASYVTKAKNTDIEINITAMVPTMLHITTMDLCVVLANGLENAINACKKISDRNQRKISLSCHMKNNKILIQIANPYEGDILFKKDLPVTNQEGHGKGTKSIVNIATKYHGLYSFSGKGNVFILNVIM